MDLRNGKIRDEDKMTVEQLAHSIQIFEQDMTKKQKENMEVSLNDHRSKLGKKLTEERRKKGYTKMTRNQKRNLRRRLKGK